MIFPGHLAIAVFLHKVTKADLPTVVAATVMPDVVDKSLAQVSHVAPSGRYAMHTAVGWLISTLFILVLAGKERACGWALGYMGHLVADGPNLPLFLPFRHYDFGNVTDLDDFLYDVVTTAAGQKQLLTEFLLLALALLMPSRPPNPPLRSRWPQDAEETDAF